MKSFPLLIRANSLMAIRNWRNNDSNNSVCSCKSQLKIAAITHSTSDEDLMQIKDVSEAIIISPFQIPG